MNLDKILSLIGAAQAMVGAAAEIAAEAGAVLSETDQAKLRDHLARLASENNAAHAKLQALLG